MKLKTGALLVNTTLLTIMTTACGGGSGSALESHTNPSSSTSSANAVSASKLGYGSGGEFREGIIHVAGPSDGGTLSAGGTTRLTVNLVNTANTLVTEPTTVTFNSTCYASGEAIFSNEAGTPTNKITTDNGEASITFKDNGCAKTDAITATATVNNQISTARASLAIERDTVQAIEYVDNPKAEYISLKGTGGTETAQIQFKVTGITGIPVKDVPIHLELNTDVGGLCLANSASATCDKSTQATSDKSGVVTVIVRAGTIATPVRITATDKNTNAFTLSSQLTVSTGIPDQDSFGLAADHANPMGWEYNNKEVKFTVSLGDAFNNPPPVGTAVSFRTDGGRIEPSCTTDKNGDCTVTWWSNSPRDKTYQKYPGRERGIVTVLAHAQGNESFTDTDGDGFYTPGEEFDDIGEAALNINSPADGEYVDFNKDGKYTPADTKYNGVLCRDNDAQQNLCTKNSLIIHKHYTIVMSSNTAGSITLSGSGLNRTLTISDINGNSMPLGTKVFVLLGDKVIRATGSVTSSTETDFDASTVTAVVPSQTTENVFSIIFPTEGTYTIVVTAPDGIQSFKSVTVN